MIGVWDWDVPAARIRSDERFARLCGLDPAAAAEGVAVLDVMRLLHPDDLERVRSEIREVFATGSEYSIEYRVRVEGGDRTSGVEGKSVAGRVGLGGRRVLKKKK